LKLITNKPAALLCSGLNYSDVSQVVDVGNVCDVGRIVDVGKVCDVRNVCDVGNVVDVGYVVDVRNVCGVGNATGVRNFVVGVNQDPIAFLLLDAADISLQEFFPLE
jgi:hypothetical protein